jgi:chitin disaccharide deacetylase
MLTMNRPRKIIVNADDFGMSAEANRAIVEAFEGNLISSTTLMTNMPGFDDACDLAHHYRLLGKIGLHLNLTEGYPLSERIRRCSRFCDEKGTFLKRRTKLWMSEEEISAVELEAEAQVEACLDKGITPTHLDSHHHVHTEWPIGAVVIKVARKYEIAAIRLARNCGPGISLCHRLYKWAYNNRLRRHGLAKTVYFGSVTDVQEILETAPGDVEVMVHLTSEDRDASADLDRYCGLERKCAAYQLSSYSAFA